MLGIIYPCLSNSFCINRSGIDPLFVKQLYKSSQHLTSVCNVDMTYTSKIQLKHHHDHRNDDENEYRSAKLQIFHYGLFYIYMQ